MLTCALALKDFFSLLKSEFSWTSINCFYGFLKRSDREGSSSLNKGRRLAVILSNDDCVFNYFIKLRDYIVTKQRGLCDLSEIAETLSIVYVKVFRLFIYWLYENTGAVNELPRSRIHRNEWRVVVFRERIL